MYICLCLPVSDTLSRTSAMVSFSIETLNSDTNPPL